MELPSVGEEMTDLAVGGLAGGAGVAESDQQGVFAQVVVLGLDGERVVLAGLFGFREGVGIELLRCDVTWLRQRDADGFDVTDQIHGTLDRLRPGKIHGLLNGRGPARPRLDGVSVPLVILTCRGARRRCVRRVAAFKALRASVARFDRMYFMNVAVFTTDFSVAGHEFRDVSLSVITPRIRWGEASRPASRTEIDVLVVMEILELIDRGVMSAVAVRGMLDGLVEGLKSEAEREDEQGVDVVDEPVPPMTPAEQVRSDSRLVYAVSSEAEPRIVKIGVSQDVQARRKTLQSGSGSPLVIRWTSKGGGYLEGRLHDRFRSRALGREWFDFRNVTDPVRRIAAAARTVLHEVGGAVPEPGEPASPGITG